MKVCLKFDIPNQILDIYHRINIRLGVIAKKAGKHIIMLVEVARRRDPIITRRAFVALWPILILNPRPHL